MRLFASTSTGSCTSSPLHLSRRHSTNCLNQIHRYGKMYKFTSSQPAGYHAKRHSLLSSFNHRLLSASFTPSSSAFIF
ncbi:hypothetical protein EYC84_008240 [Monilinia fructicola]|uniref:Uncharacterized protein n=1 Tax=Monilinia fructicola TaxID=38448 RepID=A0A5M9JL51_MONFR|nr:hypothetical protein EYC84_008240 [Monilinia fructicola]